MELASRVDDTICQHHGLKDIVNVIMFGGGLLWTEVVQGYWAER